MAATIAVGLVLMHHVVADPTAMGAMVHPGSMSAAASTAAPVAQFEAASVPTASEPGCLDCGAMMGHMCLAVLVAAALLAGLVLFTVVGLQRPPLRPATTSGGASPARAPPDSGVRLSQLGVLRR